MRGCGGVLQGLRVYAEREGERSIPLVSCVRLEASSNACAVLRPVFILEESLG